MTAHISLTAGRSESAWKSGEATDWAAAAEAPAGTSGRKALNCLITATSACTNGIGFVLAAVVAADGCAALVGTTAVEEKEGERRRKSSSKLALKLAARAHWNAALGRDECTHHKHSNRV